MFGGYKGSHRVSRALDVVFCGCIPIIPGHSGDSTDVIGHLDWFERHHQRRQLCLGWDKLLALLHKLVILVAMITVTNYKQVWDEQPNQPTEHHCQLCEEDEGEGGQVERRRMLKAAQLRL